MAYSVEAAQIRNVLPPLTDLQAPRIEIMCSSKPARWQHQSRSGGGDDGGHEMAPLYSSGDVH